MNIQAASSRNTGLAASGQYITFKIDLEEYAVDIMAVREIKAWVPSTSLPNSPKYVRGVINLRGLIVPIFDLRARFGQGETEVGERHVMVIVNVDERNIGMLVDAVSDIFSCNEKDIQPVPEMDRTVDSEYLAGLVTVDGRMIAMLDIGKLFDLTGLPAPSAETAAA